MKNPTLRTCPFCGGEAEVVREGTPRQSAIVGCTECHARLESNENGAGFAWNQRSGGLAITRDTRSSLNHWAAAMLDETMPEAKRREESRSYAVETLVRLVRDNPDLAPEYTAELQRREAARKMTL